MANDLIFLQIDGKTPPTPRDLTPVYADFDSDNSTRNEAGYLIRECIRQGQVSPKFTWRITTKQLNELLNMIKPEKLQVAFYDPMTMDLHEFTGYAQATRQPKLVTNQQVKDYESLLWDFECSFIEY